MPSDNPQATLVDDTAPAWHLPGLKSETGSMACGSSLKSCMEASFNPLSELFPLSGYFRFKSDSSEPECLLHNTHFSWTTLDKHLETSSYNLNLLHEITDPTIPLLVIEDGVSIEAPLALEYPCGLAKNSPARHHVVVVGEKSHITLIEAFNFNHFSPTYRGRSPQKATFLLKEGAQVNRIRIFSTHCPIEEETSIWILANATLTTTTLRVGKNPLTRSVQNIYLTGSQATLNLRECFLGKDKQKAESHINVEHRAPYTESNLLVKSILKDESQFAFEGNASIFSEADHSKAHQKNFNCLLSERSRVISIPNLNIFTKNVEASHGSGTKHLDDESLFYMQTRGLTEEQANNLFVQGFIEDTLAFVPNTLAEKCRSLLV